MSRWLIFLITQACFSFSFTAQPKLQLPENGTIFGFWGYTATSIDFSLRSTAPDHWIAECGFNTELDGENKRGVVEIRRIGEALYQFTVVEGPSNTPTRPFQATVESTNFGDALIGSYIDQGISGPEPAIRVIGLFLDQSLEKHPNTPMETVQAPIEPAKNFDVRFLTSEDGLAHDAVRCIERTRDEFLWFGTINGLSRFDGSRFFNFTPVSTNGALPDPNVTRLLELRDGRLAIGTKGSGIFFFDGNTFGPGKDNLTMGNYWILRLLQAGDETLWVIGVTPLRRTSLFQLDLDGSILRQLSPSDVKRFPYRPEGDEPSFSGIVSATAETVVFGLNSYGFVSYNLETKDTTTLLPLQGYAYPTLLQNGDIFLDGRFSAVFMKSDWTGRKLITPPKDGPFGPHNAYFSGHSAFLSKNGSLWAAASNALIKVEERSWLRFDLGENGPGSGLRELHDDHQGNLWFYTQSQGIGCVRIKPFERLEIPTPLDDLDDIRSVLNSDGTLFLCDRNLQIRDPEGQWQTLSLKAPGIQRHERRQSVSSIAPSPDDSGIYYAALSGPDPDRRVRGVEYPILARIEDKEVTFVYLPDHIPETTIVHSCAWSSSHGVLLATLNGVYQYSNEKWTLHDLVPGTKNERAYLAYLDPKTKGIWLGFSDLGLIYFDSGIQQQWTTQNSELQSNAVTSALRDSTGRLWIGTQHGLCLLGSNRIHAITFPNQVQSPCINSIVEDHDGNLWLSTSAGILSGSIEELAKTVEESSKVAASIVRFPMSVVIPRTIFRPTFSPSGCLTDDGNVVFVTETAGAVIFDPRKALESARPPIPGIDSFQISVSTSGELAYVRSRPDVDSSKILPPEASHLVKFEFSAREFRDPEKISYQYRLLGLSDTWIEAGQQPFALFPNLQPGQYTFELAASNQRLVRSPRVVTSRFHIQPFYWETVWFRLCVLALALVTAFLTHKRATITRIRIQTLQAEAELNRERSRISRDMHDQIGNSLAQIQMIGKARRNGHSRDHLSHSGLDERLVELSGDASRALRDIVWALNSKKSRFEDICRYFQKLGENAVEHSSMKLVFESEGDPNSAEFSVEQKHELTMLFNGAISNALKHSFATLLRVSMKVKAQNFELVISDDGVGFEVHTQEGNGIDILRGRVAKLKGTIEIESSPGNGACYKIVVPLKQG